MAQVTSVMTANPSCCREDTPLRDVAQLMIDHDCGMIPVVDTNGRPVGAVTDRDIAVRIVARGKDASSSRAGDAMTSPVTTIDSATSLHDATCVMEAEKIRRVKNREQGVAARDKVLEALLEATEVPAPEGIVNAEFESRAHDAVHAFDHNEDALNAHLEREGQTREEFDAELRESAVQAVRTQLLLDALAEANQVGVDQNEFTERVLFNAQRLGMSPDEYFRRIQEGNQLAAIFAEVRRGKALAQAVEQATVTNASGEVLDVAELFGLEKVDEDAADSAVELADEAGVPVVLVTFGPEGRGVERFAPAALLDRYEDLPGLAARILG